MEIIGYTQEDLLASLGRVKQIAPPAGLSDIVDKDIDEWQVAQFGQQSIYQLKLSPDTPSSIAQGAPFLNKAKLVEEIVSYRKNLYRV